jgi:hypothetical protein
MHRVANQCVDRFANGQAKLAHARKFLATWMAILAPPSSMTAKEVNNQRASAKSRFLVEAL